MSRSLAVDGLWRCLCPSFSPRLMGTAVAQRGYSKLHSRHERGVDEYRPGYGQRRFLNQLSRDNTDVFHSLHGRPHHRLEEESFKVPKSIPECYDQLRAWAAQGNVKEVEQLVNFLVQHRHEEPNLRLYSALVAVNVDPKFGRAAKVAILWDELQSEGISPDSGICHDALRVLAVHPDCLLRSRILQHMQERWLDLNEDGWHNVIVGLLREKLLEQAIGRLEEMTGRDIQVQEWLWDFATYVLCEFGEIDEALKITKSRDYSDKSTISLNVWYNLLDKACAEFHYDTIRHIWSRRIELGYLKPSAGQCLAILNTAARVGDTQLATDVFRVLGFRNTVFRLHHYELLIEAYVAAGDLKTAFTILCIMYAARSHPNIGSTRTLYKYLRHDTSRLDTAFEMLQELRREHRVIPLAAMNVLLEADIDCGDPNRSAESPDVSHSQANLAKAITHYKSLHQICHRLQPTVATFNILIRGCNRAHDKHTAMFLASEMNALGINPDPLTYDRLMLTCLTQAKYEDALRYFEEMKRVSFWPRKGTLVALVQKCCEAGDLRCWEVIGWAKKHGYDLAWLKTWAEQHWQETLHGGYEAQNGIESPMQEAETDDSADIAAQPDSTVHTPPADRPQEGVDAQPV